MRIVIIGGGPGGYEAALVAAQLGAQVTVVDRDGLGGACVLTDCVPSKTLIATSGMMAALEGAAALGLRAGPRADRDVSPGAITPGAVSAASAGAAPGRAARPAPARAGPAAAGPWPPWTRRGSTPGSAPWPGRNRRT